MTQREYVFTEIEIDAEKDLVIDVVFTMDMICPPVPESGRFGPPEFYDPGSPADWRISAVAVCLPLSGRIDVTEEQLSEMYSFGNDLIQLAYERAANDDQ